MSLQDLEKELNSIKKIIPELKKYSGQAVSILPLDIKNNLKQIKMLPPVTSGGFEKIDTILKNLYIAKDVIEERFNEIQGPQIPVQTNKNPAITPVKPVSTTPPKPQGPQPKSKYTKRAWQEG